MRNTILLKILFVFLYLVPITYKYFSLLPNKIQWISDILVVLTFLLFFFDNDMQIKRNKITRELSILFFLLITVCLISSGLNKSNFLFTILEIKRLIFPLLIYFVLEQTTSNQKYKIIKWYSVVIIIQIIVMPIQYMSYILVPNFGKYLSYGVNLVDCATGTVGRGTGAISVFLVIFFIYNYVVMKKKGSFVFLIPLLFTFSNGANVLLVISIVLLFLMKEIKIWSLKSVLSVVLLIGAGLFISSYIFKKNIFTSSYETLFLLKERKLTDKWTKKREVKGLDGGKLTRKDGYLYLHENFKQPANYFFGLGPDVIAKSTTFDVKKSKLPYVNEITNDYNLILAKFGYSGLFVFYFFWLRILLYIYKFRKKGEMFKGGFVIVLIFILSTFYSSGFVNLYFMFFIMFVLTEINTKLKKRIQI